MRSRPTLRYIAPLMALTLVAASCGGDNDEPAASDEAPVRSTTSIDTAAEAAEQTEMMRRIRPG